MAEYKSYQKKYDPRMFALLNVCMAILIFSWVVFFEAIESGYNLLSYGLYFGVFGSLIPMAITTFLLFKVEGHNDGIARYFSLLFTFMVGLGWGLFLLLFLADQLEQLETLSITLWLVPTILEIFVMIDQIYYVVRDYTKSSFDLKAIMYVLFFVYLVMMAYPASYLIQNYLDGSFSLGFLVLGKVFENTESLPQPTITKFGWHWVFYSIGGFFMLWGIFKKFLHKDIGGIIVHKDENREIIPNVPFYFYLIIGAILIGLGVYFYLEIYEGYRIADR